MSSSTIESSVEPSMYCKKCGHDLRAKLECCCSKCGQKYNPKDSKTFVVLPLTKQFRVRRELTSFLYGVLLAGAFGWGWWEWEKYQNALLIMLANAQIVDVSNGSISDISYFDRLYSVKKLYLNNTQVSDLSPLSKLRALQFLDCSGTKISNLSPLTKLTGLRELIVPKETITEAQIEELQRILPNCKIERK